MALSSNVVAGSGEAVIAGPQRMSVFVVDVDKLCIEDFASIVVLLADMLLDDRLRVEIFAAELGEASIELKSAVGVVAVMVAIVVASMLLAIGNGVPT